MMMILTDIATVPLSTAGAKDERRGGGEVAEGGKPDHQGHGGHDNLILIIMIILMVMII